MIRRLLLALAAGLGLLGLAAAPGAGARRRRRRCATPSRSPRPASTRRRSATCIRAPWPRASSTRRWSSTSWRGRSGCGPTPPRRMPEVSADFRSFTFRIKPGIYFADDPAFGGSKRELTAADYVYSIKRHYDPRWKSGNLYLLESAKILGLSELRKQAIERQEALRLRHRGRGPARAGPLHLADPPGRAQPALPLQPGRRLVHRRAGARGGRGLWRQGRRAPGRHRAVPAGAVEAQLAHGAGERNPNYREVLYDEQPPADDAAARRPSPPQFKGRRLPMIDRVQIAVIEEAQPRWLSFLNGEQDLLEGLPAEFADIAIPNNQLAPNLAKRGIDMLRAPRADVSLHLLRHGASAGRRQHARQGGAAPRHRAGGATWSARSAWCGAARRCRRSRRSRPAPGATTRPSRAR